MKKYFLLLIFFCFYSCKPTYVKINENLKGEWVLKDFAYEDVQGNKAVTLQSYKMSFSSTNKGTILVGNINYDFGYNFGYEEFDTGYSTCSIDVKNKTQLPIEVIGKVQVYSYKFLNKNTIQFYVDKEYDFISKQIIKNVQYTFVKN